MINGLRFGVDKPELVSWEDAQLEFAVNDGGPRRWCLPIRSNNLRLNTAKHHLDTCDQNPTDIWN